MVPVETTAKTPLISAIPTLPVSDVERAVSFYEKMLGFTRIAAREGYGRVRRDDVEIHFWHAGGGVRGAERYLAGTGRCRIAVSDLDALDAEYRDRGVLDESAGGVAVRDPDGNVLTFG